MWQEAERVAENAATVEERRCEANERFESRLHALETTAARLRHHRVEVVLAERVHGHYVGATVTR